jgi:membrane-bound lytic murein transglycosylase F
MIPHRRQCLSRTALLACTLILSACELPYVEQGDLAQLRERGSVRILVPRYSRRHGLPRSSHPLDFERRLAEQFVRTLDLEPRFVWVSQHDDLVPALLAGRGDLIAAGLTVTEAAKTQLAFSAPIHHVRELVVTRLSDTSLTEPRDLSGRELWIRRSSAHWETAQQLERDHGVRIVAASERLDTPELLYRVAEGEIDLTIADDFTFTEALSYMPDLHPAFAVGSERPVAWAMRPAAVDLLMAVDSFLVEEDVELRRPERYLGDLPALRERGTLRVITANSAATYFVWRGELLGFEYDLARRFAEHLDLDLQIVVPPSQADLLSWLVQGYGDVAAASLTPTDERRRMGVEFSRPYHRVVETLVTRAGDDRIDGVEQLADRTIVVRRRSSYWDTVIELQARGIDVRLEPAPEDLATEEVIARVASGDYDLTIADSHILEIELAWRSDIAPGITLRDSVVHGWAVREEGTELLNAINAFIRREYRGLWFNLTHDKYFDTPQRMQEQVTERVAVTGAVSPFDSLFHHYASAVGFDWRLVAAQAYQESRFNPQARSFAGAVGLMQTMPLTAEAYGVDPFDPEGAIMAGVSYLRHQWDLFGDVESDERLWFALASYNAGYGHVQDARRLARRMGRDPNRWTGELESVMPLLARVEYHERAQHGYCRCQEPVDYVRRIREQYRAYTRLLPETPVAELGP